MSTSLFDLFKFSKLLDVSDGSLTLMGIPVNVVPTSILCNQQKMLIKTLGIEDAYKEIYGSSKKGSYDYNSAFIRDKKFTDQHKIVEWQAKIVAFAGWGDLVLGLLDAPNHRVVVQFKDSPYPKSYGTALYPVDFVATGFVAGGVSALLGTDVDALETKCQARGDAFCQIETGIPVVVDRMRKELWENWKVY
jgi:predicted hydrocarbon binding protein